LIDGKVVAVRPAVGIIAVVVATQGIELRVTVSVALPEGLRIAILVMVVSVTYLRVPGEARDIPVVAVISQDVAIGVFAGSVAMAVPVFVGREELTAAEGIGASIDGALDVVLARRPDAGRDASKIIRLLAIWKAKLRAIAERAV
jgi:hypothetical protein